MGATGVRQLIVQPPVAPNPGVSSARERAVDGCGTSTYFSSRITRRDPRLEPLNSLGTSLQMSTVLRLSSTPTSLSIGVVDVNRLKLDVGSSMPKEWHMSLRVLDSRKVDSMRREISPREIEFHFKCRRRHMGGGWATCSFMREAYNIFTA
ncbi:hypothetical protein HYPSUDRAFT_816264 [Hypholoma sublateritium FD-334 SS-4]|uniref:Uncharacterized protein n=1 Tax=Hypholoma sublateritium (strain FD-334 SS-4) TaxID=945553 RepID=A0A0D2NUV4_HYPSF|nr:hypothetical protein HYPSUDRAFT_816264 [Hypholoma sublateritium FD-334 SS-4]